eukprot:5832610-Pyramimonas_sp.AAC.1
MAGESRFAVLVPRGVSLAREVSCAPFRSSALCSFGAAEEGEGKSDNPRTMLAPHCLVTDAG